MSQKTGAVNQRGPVLVVDDDDLQRKEIVRCLMDLDIETREASDGAEALAVLATERPPVIIMDIRMPILDGVAAAKRMATNDKWIPRIILVTGDPDSLWRAEHMLEQNSISVLEKPISLRELIPLVTRELGIDHKGAA